MSNSVFMPGITAAAHGIEITGRRLGEDQIEIQTFSKSKDRFRNSRERIIQSLGVLPEKSTLSFLVNL